MADSESRPPIEGGETHESAEENGDEAAGVSGNQVSPIGSACALEPMANYKLMCPPSPDEIDFDKFEEYPWFNDDMDWLVQVWRDVRDGSDERPPVRTKRPLFQRGHEPNGIRDVWAKNLDEEFHIIRQVVANYPYIAMDTEFPGIVARPIGHFKNSSDYQYQTLRCNVDLLRIIQLGLTFLDENGKTAPGPCSTWQFNFKFNLSVDPYAQDSIDLLRRCGIQFKRHETEGIDAVYFAELLISSGIALSDNITWLSFHSVFDFGYLLKILLNTHLPPLSPDFFVHMRHYFPCFYDIKYLMKAFKNVQGGLEEVASCLQIERLGGQHQAGSDSLLTGRVFFKIKELYEKHNMDETRYVCRLYGMDPPGECDKTLGDLAKVADLSMSGLNPKP